MLASDNDHEQQLSELLNQGLMVLNEGDKILPYNSLFVVYIKLLHQWNRTYNLTAVRDPQQMVTRHILDSLAVQPYLNGQRILDAGTGAGLPGIPLAIINPQREFFLVDSNGKKTRFLFQAVHELGLNNVEVVQARVEEFTAVTRFDTIVSRAFASIADMLQSTRHLCTPQGLFLAMKGVYPQAEIVNIPRDFTQVNVHNVRVPGLHEQRHVVCISH